MAEDCPEQYEPDYSIEDEDELFVLAEEQSSESSEDPQSEKIYTYTFEELVSLCGRIGMSSEMVDGVLVQLIVQHFSYPDQYLYSALNSLQYKPNGTGTLNILSFSTWKPDTEFSNPAIVYHNLGQQPQRIGIGDQFYHDSSRPEAEGFARQYSGAHRLMCIGTTDGVAELLASELSEWLTEFSHQMVRNLPFYDFQVGARSQPKLYSELGDKVGVSFTVHYTYIWQWEVAPVGPPTKANGISLDFF